MESESSREPLCESFGMKAASKEDPFHSEAANHAVIVGSGVQFSEAGEEWRDIPPWVSYLIRFGYSWQPASRSRRVAFLSMPCDTPAAGLISLGALIHGLGDPDANDEAGHFSGLSRFTRQYSASCRTCKIRCDPSEKGCGYTERASGIVRDKDGRRYQVVESIDHPIFGPAIKCAREGETRYLLSNYAREWHIEAQVALGTNAGAAAPLCDAYSSIVPSAVTLPGNLSRSYSGICLAGRSRGESSSREVMATIRFASAGKQHNLADLLSIDDWSASDSVSRISFYNSRTGHVDRFGCAPSLVVTDGDSSLLRVLDESRFQNSDVIGVFERTLDRDRLEAIGSRLAELRRWYEEDPESAKSLAPAPPGIGLAILRRRSS